MTLLATAAHRLGDSSEAQSRLDDFCQAFPDNEEAALLRISILVDVGEMSSAFELASMAVVRGGKRSKEFDLWAAIAQGGTRDWRGGLARLERFVSKKLSGPALRDFVESVGKIQAVLPDPAAKSLFPQALSARFRDPILTLHLFLRHYNNGQHEIALQWAKILAQLAPWTVSADNYKRMAVSARACGALEHAEAWLESSHGRSDSQTFHWQALKATSESLTEKAKALLLIAIDHAPYDSSLWFDLCRLLIAEGRLDEARSALDKVIGGASSRIAFDRLKLDLAVLVQDEKSMLALASTLRADADYSSTSELDLISMAIGAALQQRDLERATQYVGRLARAVERFMSDCAPQSVILTYLGILNRFDAATAEDLANRAIQLNYGRGPLYDLLADRCRSIGQLERALEHAAHAVDIDGRPFGRNRRYIELLIDLGRWPDADCHSRALLLRDPSNAVALKLRAEALAGANRIDEAEGVWRTIISGRRSPVADARNFAAFLRRHHRLASTIDQERSHVARYPNDRLARLRLAIFLAEIGELAEADASFGRLENTNIYDLDVLEAHVHLRFLRMLYEDAQDLIRLFDVPRQADPRVAFRVNRLYRLLLNYESGEALLRRIEARGANNFAVLIGLFEHLVERGLPAEARMFSERLLTLYPLNYRVHFLDGLFHQQIGETEAARKSFEVALFLKPDDVPTTTQLGLLEEEALNFEDALRHYESSTRSASVHSKKAGARTTWHRVLTCLMTGRRAEAVLAHRDQCDLFDEAFPSNIALWRGEPLGGKEIFIAMRGGPGDEVRIATLCFANLAASVPKQILFACDARLTSLLSRSFPEVSLLPSPTAHRLLHRLKSTSTLPLDRVWPGATRRIVDVAMPIDGIPSADFVCHSDGVFHEVYFRGVLEQGEKLRFRPLVADPEQRQRMRSLLDQLDRHTLKVGICWRGAYWNQYRNRGFLTIEELQPILGVTGITFIDLQVNKTRQEIEALRAAGVHSVECLDLHNDFDGMAALISELDLVLTPGVTVRDLAGSLSVPTWSFTVIPGASDIWRKTPDRTDCWFPSIIHYDLLKFGSRVNVIAAIASDLASLRSASRSRPL